MHDASTGRERGRGRQCLPTLAIFNETETHDASAGKETGAKAGREGRREGGKERGEAGYLQRQKRHGEPPSCQDVHKVLFARGEENKRSSRRALTRRTTYDRLWSGQGMVGCV